MLDAAPNPTQPWTTGPGPRPEGSVFSSCLVYRSVIHHIVRDLAALGYGSIPHRQFQSWIEGRTRHLYALKLTPRQRDNLRWFVTTSALRAGVAPEYLTRRNVQIHFGE